MTQSFAIPPARSTGNRVAATVVALLGGLFWIGGMHLFVFFATQIKIMYDKFQIYGGLPTSTELALGLRDFLAAYPIPIHVLWAAGLIALVAAAIRIRSRRTFRWIGFLAAVCFFLWYLLLIGLAVVAFLPMVKFGTVGCSG